MMLHIPVAPLKVILESGIVKMWAWLTASALHCRQTPHTPTHPPLHIFFIRLQPWKPPPAASANLPPHPRRMIPIS